MRIHLLLTDEMAKIKPIKCRVASNFGEATVSLSDGVSLTGRNCIVQGDKQAFIDWLGGFDGFVKGVHFKSLEGFEYVHISDIALERPVCSLLINRLIEVADIKIRPLDSSIYLSELVKYSDGGVAYKYTDKRSGVSIIKEKIMEHSKYIWQKAQQQQG